MSSPPTVQDLLLRNKDYSYNHTPAATFEEYFGTGSKAPSVAVVACADPRCIPESFLKLETWEVVVIRTAGSNIDAALPSLIAIDSLVGLKEIMIVNHTDCGGLAIRDDTIKCLLRDRAPGNEEQISSFDFGEITGSLEDKVRKQVATARNTPFLREDLRKGVSGYIYDIKTGGLVEVDAAA